ncbi:GntR family transcriptional regulator [Streptomyces vinaceus]
MPLERGRKRPGMAGRGYRALAEELRRRIGAGEFEDDRKFPSVEQLMDEYEAARQTIRGAIGVLSDEGAVVPVRKTGVPLRDRTAVTVPLGRYGQVVASGNAKGPWEIATAAQGLEGTMRFVSVGRVDADQPTAALLALAEGDALIYRVQQALICPDDIVQIQHAWYPVAIAEAAGLDRDDGVIGNMYGALTAAGHRPAASSGTVSSRAPTAAEARQFGRHVAVLALERVTHDASGQPLEVLRAVAPADRLELSYHNLPLEDL